MKKLPHHEKADFFGQDNNAGKSRRLKKGRKTVHEMIDNIKAATGMSLHELSGAGEDRKVWTSLIFRVTRSWNQLKGT